MWRFPTPKQVDILKDLPFNLSIKNNNTYGPGRTSHSYCLGLPGPLANTRRTRPADHGVEFWLGKELISSFFGQLLERSGRSADLF
jgi:hypothetical protein